MSSPKILVNLVNDQISNYYNENLKKRNEGKKLGQLFMQIKCWKLFNNF